MDPTRITLRPFTISDAGDVFKWAGDDDVTRYLRWNSVKTIEEAKAHIQHKAIPHPWRRSICLDGRSIGYVSFKPDSGDGRCRAQIGYAVAREFWGQGIATAAVSMAVRRVFEDLPEVMRLQAVVEVEHKSSQRVLEKTGFEREGLLKKYGYCKGEIRDMFVYSLINK